MSKRHILVALVAVWCSMVAVGGNVQPAHASQLEDQPAPGLPYCDQFHAEYPAVVKVGDTYYAYYSGFGCKWQLFYATSRDGVHFDKQGQINIADGWADQRAFPFVMYTAGVFRLYYGGGLPYRIGYAESRDGVNFTARAQPVLDVGGAGQWDSDQLVRPSVVEVSPFANNLWQRLSLANPPSHLYLMYYNGFGNDQSAVGLAYSSDGITWQRYAANPIVTSPTGIYTSFALVAAGTTYLYYHTDNGIYLMLSADGLDFKPYSPDPILTPSTTDGWDAGLVYGAFVRPDDSGGYVMYYNGIGQPDGNYGMVGMATSPDLRHFTPNPANPVITVGNTPANFEVQVIHNTISLSWHNVVTDTTNYLLALHGEDDYTDTIELDNEAESLTVTLPMSGSYSLNLLGITDQLPGWPTSPVTVTVTATPSPPAAPKTHAAHISVAALLRNFYLALPLLFLIAGAEWLVGRKKRRAAPHQPQDTSPTDRHTLAKRGADGV